MLTEARGVVEQLRGLTTALDPACLEAADAERLLEVFSEGANLCQAAVTLLSRRVQQSNRWKRNGHKKASEYLAHKTGVSVGEAVGTLKTAEALEDARDTREAFQAGTLSPTQAKEIAGAVQENPEAEASLLETAENGDVKELRDDCRKARLARESDGGTKRVERQHERRFVRFSTDRPDRSPP